MGLEKMENDCEHIAFLRRLFDLQGGEIRPPICEHCGTENKFPLNSDLENVRGELRYVLRCTKCGGIILEE